MLGNVDEYVEGAVGHRALESGDLVERVYEVVPSFLVLETHPLRIVLRTGERPGIGLLCDDVRTDVGKRLELDDLPYYLRITAGESDSPAAHRVILGGASHSDNPRGIFRRLGRRHMRLVVDDLVVGLVGEDVEVVLLGELVDLLQLLVVEHPAGRIARTVEHDNLGLLADPLLQLGEVDCEVLLRQQRIEDRNSVGILDDPVVGGKTGIGSQYLIVRVYQCPKREMQGTARPVVYHHLGIGIVLDPVVLPKAVGNGLARLRKTVRRRIADKSVFENLLALLEYVLGSVEIGLPHLQPREAFDLRSHVENLSNGRCLYRLRTFGKINTHDSPSPQQPRNPNNNPYRRVPTIRNQASKAV